MWYMGFAFAKVPGGKSICWKCLLFEFTGRRKDIQRKHYQLLKNRKLIIMVTNYEYNQMRDENLVFWFLEEVLLYIMDAVVF